MPSVAVRVKVAMAITGDRYGLERNAKDRMG